MRDTGVSAHDLLTWYDTHGRDLPWRIKGGAAVDPYRVWLSEVMLQQTTVAAVKAYFARFTARWPTVTDLAQAEDAAVMAEWAGLGYYARARNMLACARAVVARHGGVFPDTLSDLRTLPGIGPYTAAAIASIAYGHPETVVDGNVERVMARVFAVQTPLPAAKPELTTLAAQLTPRQRPGDYAQAVMDLGATICTPRNPACTICPWNHGCQARQQNLQPDLPRKTAKPLKPTRTGTVWLALREDGALLLERRPDKGLLGGTIGFPTTDWDGSTAEAPLQTHWQPVGHITHTFTHFHLTLTVLTAHAPQNAAPHRGEFLGKNLFSPQDLPTLMRKAHTLAYANLEKDGASDEPSRR